MGSDSVAYKPYRGALWVIWAPVVVILACVSFLIAWFDPVDYSFGIIFALAILFSVWEGMYLVRRASIAMQFCETEAKVILGKNAKSYAWDSFRFLYNEKHYKGGAVLVLSPIELSAQTRKRMVHCRSIASRRYSDGVLIIPMFHSNWKSANDYVIAHTTHCVSE